MAVHASDVQQVNYLRDELRHLDAQFQATPRTDPAWPRLMREVHHKRGIWRRAETMIGRRSAGLKVGGNTLPYSVLAPIQKELDDIKQLRTRNTGRRIS